MRGPERDGQVEQDQGPDPAAAVAGPALALPVQVVHVGRSGHGHTRRRASLKCGPLARILGE